MPLRRWNKPKSVDWRGLPSSSTSFCIFIIRDEAFSPKPMVFLVYNHADKGRRALLLPTGLESTEDKKKGKPAGYGMPGGGLNPEWMENQEGAAIREGGNESGVRVIKARLIPMPGEKNKALVLNKKTGELIRWIPYIDGHQVHLEINPWEIIHLNPLNYYLAEVDWFNSKPRQFLLNLKNELIAEGGCTTEDIAQFGISINTLTREELVDLDVDTEEVAEIGGFALLPIDLLRWMKDNNFFYLNPDEDPRERKNHPDNLTSYVYYSHVMRILEGIDIMGVV